MLVSIVMPNYNKEKFLRSSILSVLDQEYSSIELIIVDDASTDESEKILSSITDKRVRIIRLNVNMGVSVARNIGMSKARGELIALMDSDDTWHKAKIGTQVEQLILSGCPINYCAGIETDKEGKLVRSFDQGFNGNISELFHKRVTEGVIALGGSSIIFKRDLLPLVGYFDPTMRGPSEDWDFFRRLCKVAPVKFIPVSLVQYRRSESGRSSVDILNYRSENLYAVKKMIREDNLGKIKEIKILLHFNLCYLMFFFRTKGGIILLIKLITTSRKKYSERKKRLSRWYMALKNNK